MDSPVVDSAQFVPPTGRSEHDSDSGDLRVDGENIGGKPVPKAVMLMNNQQRPASFRVTNSYYDVACCVSDAFEGVVMKPRPGTAREGLRTPLMQHEQQLVSPRASWAVDAPATHPESENNAMDARSDSNAQVEQTYINQLKEDIMYLGQLLNETATPQSNRSNTHIKKVQSMRENKAASEKNQHESVRAQIVRYNYSSDPAQVAFFCVSDLIVYPQLSASKRKLEAILGDSLLRLMQKHIELTLENEATEADPQQNGREIAEHVTSPSREAYASRIHGCAASTSSLYTGGFLCVLQQTEKLRTKVMSLHAEKAMLQRVAKDKENEVQRVNEQLLFFKDALATNKSGRQGWTNLQANWRKAVAAELEQSKPNPEINTARSLEESNHGDEIEKIEALEKSLENAQQLVKKFENEREMLKAELRMARAHADKLTHQTAALTHDLEQAAETRSRELLEQGIRFNARIESLESDLRATKEKFLAYEQAALHDKHQLRREKLDLENALRRTEEELQNKLQSVAVDHEVRATAQVKSLHDELDTVRKHMQVAERRLLATAEALSFLKEEKRQFAAQLDQTKAELDKRTQQLEEALSKQLNTTAALDSNEKLVKQTQQQLNNALEEIERQHELVLHRENQLQLLESKLHRSVLMEDEAEKQIRTLEDTKWNQKVAALEHELESERQQMALLKEQHAKSLSQEQEKAKHALTQVQSVTEELETANLCIAERQKLRDRELAESEEQRRHHETRIQGLLQEIEHLRAEAKQSQSPDENNAASLSETEDLHKQLTKALDKIDVLETANKTAQEAIPYEVSDLRDQLAAALQEIKALESTVIQEKEAFEAASNHIANQYATAWNQQLEGHLSVFETTVQACAAEIDTLKQALVAVTDERDGLLQKLAGVAQATPRSSSALSEARVELQRAKQKISALEEKLSSRASSQSKEVESKMAVLSARERKSAEDQKLLKRQRADVYNEKRMAVKERESLEQERKSLEQDRQSLTASLTQVEDEKNLVKQSITLLATRLRWQLELLSIIPIDIASTSKDVVVGRRREQTGTIQEFLAKFQSQHAEQWRSMQQRWAEIQTEMDDADWQLVHIKNRLEELTLDQLAGIAGSTGSGRNAFGSCPFSAAVAAGKETLPIAEQLKASISKRMLGTFQCSEHPVTDTNQSDGSTEKPKEDDHESFAAALAKEMKAMRERYEAKVDELQEEMRKTQRLRAEATHRLRVELDEEKKRSQQCITQLNERCASLEARLAALQSRYSLLQDQEIELLEKYAGAPSEVVRRETLQALLALIADSCREEMALRSARQQERVAKLHAYCGSSSVTVDRDDKKQLQ
ncbi:TPA: hypothetical protein N0F65_012241 [Lagenidium giganteum]|uniref:GRIP domain-containing protein n=1 Tax=Lagenidium giganteum TaxID=4803 RepID=A0AAV2ZCA6_9STRA|nr:TPA: hypothetical protein N0F65_012241 [Lagenidium giganteum]